MKIIRKIKKNWKQGKNRKRIYLAVFLVFFVLFGNLHPLYLFLAQSNLLILILSYENHLKLRNLRVKKVQKK